MATITREYLEEKISTKAEKLSNLKGKAWKTAKERENIAFSEWSLRTEIWLLEELLSYLTGEQVESRVRF